LYQSHAKTQDKMKKLLVLCHVFAPDGFYAVPTDLVLSHVTDLYADDIKTLR